MILLLPVPSFVATSMGANGTLSAVSAWFTLVPASGAGALMLWSAGRSAADWWKPRAFGPRTANLVFMTYASWLAAMFASSAAPQFGAPAVLVAAGLWLIACVSAVVERPSEPGAPVTNWVRWLALALAIGLVMWCAQWNSPQPPAVIDRTEKQVVALDFAEDVRVKHAEGDMWVSPRLHVYVLGNDDNTAEEVQEFLRTTRDIIRSEASPGDAEIEYHQRRDKGGITVRAHLGPYFDGTVAEVPQQFE